MNTVLIDTSGWMDGGGTYGYGGGRKGNNWLLMSQSPTDPPFTPFALVTPNKNLPSKRSGGEKANHEWTLWIKTTERKREYCTAHPIKERSCTPGYKGW